MKITVEQGKEAASYVKSNNSNRTGSSTSDVKIKFSYALHPFTNELNLCTSFGLRVTYFTAWHI